MVIIMNISEEKRTQICAALAKAQQDIKRIQLPVLWITLRKWRVFAVRCRTWCRNSVF